MSELATVELMEGQAPSLVFCPHPLMPARDRRLVFEPPRVGEKLDRYLARVIGALPDPCIVTIGDRQVPRSWWRKLAVKPGVVIGVAAGVAGGDGNGNSNVGRVVLMIAVVVAAAYTGGAAAGAAGWSGAGAMTLGQTAAYVAASAAVMTVGMMAVNALLPLPTNDLSGAGGSAASPTYSLAGGSNRVRRYEPLPLVIGTHRMFPDQACAGYTLFVNGNDQYLFIAYNFGFGDLEITDLRIGDTLLSDYQDVTLAWATGSMPSLVAGNVDTQAGTALTATDGPLVRTTSVDTTEIHIDLQYVMFYAGDGGLEQYSVTLKFEWRVKGAPTWEPFSSADGTAAWFGTTENSPFFGFGSTDGTVTFVSGSRDVWRRTLRKTVAKGQYDVRITKVTADVSDDRTTCEISIPAIRSLQPDTGDYAGQRILALKIRASGQLNGAVSQLSGLVSHRLNGVATSNPAAWFRAFARGAALGDRRIWGAGLDVSRIDLAALDAWSTWCDAKGLSCNMVLDQALSADTVLDRIARCGRASKTWAPGKLSAVWDAGGLPVMAMFSPVNIRKGTFSISYPSEEMATELEVSYVNPDNNWQRDTVRVPANATNVRRTASVELLGCTSTALAGKEANLMFAQNLYRFRSISWEADAEGLTVRKGDVVTLSHDLTSWGEAGRLVAVASTTQLTLDRAITLPPAGCWMAVCRPSGEISYHRVQVGATEAQADEVTLLDPLPTTPAVDGSPAVDWRYLADAKATPGWRVKVTDVSPLPGMDGVRITAQDDPAEYYAAESGTFAHVATPVVNNLPVLSGLQVSEELIRAGAGYAVQLKLTWSATGDVAATHVRFRIDSGPWQDGGFATGTQQSILVPETGSAYVEVAAFNGMGQSNVRSRLSGTYEIQGQSIAPPAPTGFAVTRLADGTRTFTWTVSAVPPDVAYMEIRYASSAGTTWTGMTKLGLAPYGAGRAESAAPTAGGWTFEVRMLDVSGNYSATGARVTVTLGDDPGASLAAAIAAESAALQDGMIETYFQTSPPSVAATNIGDLWIDSDDANKLYRRNSVGWEVATDPRIGNAVSAAATAQATADSRIRTYVAEAAPGAGMVVGDLWYRASARELRRWSGASWDAVATLGADGSNLNVGLGVNLLPNTEFGGGSVIPIVLGWNPSGCTFTPLRQDDAWRPASAQCLELVQGVRNGNEFDVGADVYLNGGYNTRSTGIPVIPGKRYELSGWVAAHRADSSLGINFFDANDNYVSGGGSGWATRKSGGRDLAGWEHAVCFSTAPANAVYATLIWRKSDTDAGESTSYGWLCQPYFGEATAVQTVPSAYSPGVGRGAFVNVDKLTPGNTPSYVDLGAINTGQLNGTAASERVVLIDEAGITHSNIG